MGAQFLGEIRLFSFTQPLPTGWAACNGQLLPINQNQALFAVLGTSYGGNGQTTFALPNLQGRVPIGVGNGYDLGKSGGSPNVTISVSSMPTHVHSLNATLNNANSQTPANQEVAVAQVWSTSVSNLTPMAANAVAMVGGSQPHNNMGPSMALVFAISIAGVAP